MIAKSSGLVRPLVRALKAYVPGEQPKIKGLIKLNTNENPYPPSPKVLAAVKAAVDGRLRLYPNPTAQALRQALARWHDCREENIIVGNGSDEMLALATRCFVEPGRRGGKSTIQYLTPSYSLYPVLADIHGAKRHEVALRPDFGLPELGKFERDAALTFITTPNAPSGRGYTTKELETLCRRLRGVVVLDETYVDFAEENAMELADLLQGVFAVFSARGILCGASGVDRGAGQNTRQLQRERVGTSGGVGHVAGFAVLPGEFQTHPRDASMGDRRTGGAGI